VENFPFSIRNARAARRPRLYRSGTPSHGSNSPVTADWLVRELTPGGLTAFGPDAAAAIEGDGENDTVRRFCAATEPDR
jgi:hypothetical protein